MRITGGQWAGRTLAVPPGQGVRPTPDKVRQAIFNSLGEWIQGCTVLELFAGSGALSLECLSRGAESAVCVEKSSRHAGYLRRNIRALDANVEVRLGDAFKAGGQMTTNFDLILADPPYGAKTAGQRSQSDAQQLLDDNELPLLLNTEGRLLLGHARRDEVEIPSPWRELKTLKHGDNWIRMLGLD
tara:strand:- start:2597 stop:3154 length:558 start_codon:yes stop_codon:yes gene_type:complete